MTDLTHGGAKTDRGSEKRSRLVAAARKTVHERGVEQTTLALVAAAADVPVGNVYYYFKTKDELLGAVIDAYHNDYANGALRPGSTPDTEGAVEGTRPDLDQRAGPHRHVRLSDRFALLRT